MANSLAWINASTAYRANGVIFDGSSTNLSLAGALAGVSNTKLGILSFWFKLSGGDAALQYIMQSSDANCSAARRATNLWNTEFDGVTAAFAADSSNTYVSSSTWHHWYASWDGVAGDSSLFIDGVEDLSGKTVNNFVVTYNGSGWHFGSGNSGTASFFFGSLADLYFNTDTNLSPFTSSNIQKFRSVAGKPVFLGATGAIPTGSQPVIFFTGDASTWANNAGYGGAFTVNGTALSNDPSGP